MTRTPEELQLIALAKSRSETAVRKVLQARRHTTEALRRSVEQRQAARIDTAHALACARTGERE